MSTISIIAAIADKSAIGKNLQLLCHMPSDMKRFKELTTGHAVIMGRKTFESLPVAPLPNRKNVVLTTMPEAGFVNCFACESMGERGRDIHHWRRVGLQTGFENSRQNVYYPHPS